MEEIKFSVKLNTGELYRFMMYHYYSSFAGIFGIIMSLVAAGVLIVRFSGLQNTERMVFFILALAFTVINPVWMYVKAYNQIKLNKSLSESLEYTLNDQGLTISMGEEKSEIQWDKISRVRDDGHSLIVYVTVSRGYIWPKKKIQAEYTAIQQMLRKHVNAKKLHFK